jgi:KTSC domain
MDRTPVVSKTGMTGYAYDAATKVLEIAFASRKPGEPDKVYHYAEFTAEDWAAFQAAESKGSHFLKTIKPKFACTKIEPEKTDAQKEKTSSTPEAS